ncbi:MAG: response regulator transcription factor [Saprospiraceae bacterium]|nr:response regulator transcription factor [Saprospiraceae bacterium]
MIKIACIDDDATLMASIERFVEYQSEFQCVLKSSSIEAFVASLNDEFAADIILLDISLGEVNSLEHIRKIKALLPSAKIIIMTGHHEKKYLIKALEEGANSYYLKNSPPDQLVNTIIATYEGGAFIDPHAATNLLEFFQSQKQEHVTQLFPKEELQKKWSLTYREMQVAEGLFLEKTYKEIAQEHTIALDTVRHYLKSLYKKMQVRSKLQLIRRINEFSINKN